ncbi:RxLR effector protein [Dirofilaria immitis]
MKGRIAVLKLGFSKPANDSKPDTKNKRNAKTKWTRNWTIVINPKIICELKNLCREQFIAIIQLSSVRLSSQENNCQKMNERITIYWENGEFPSFVPKSKQARREFCDLHERMELSKNQLNNMLEQWAAKYGISEQFKLDFDEDAYYENVYRDIFKSKIDRYVRARPEIYHILLKIFNLLGDKDTAIEVINKKINELLNRLPARKWIQILRIWSVLNEEAIKESETGLFGTQARSISDKIEWSCHI